MGAFIHFTAMSVERNTQVSTASISAAAFAMGAFTSDVMSVEWHAAVSTAGVSAEGFFHGSLRFTVE